MARIFLTMCAAGYLVSLIGIVFGRGIANNEPRFVLVAFGFWAVAWLPFATRSTQTTGMNIFLFCATAQIMVLLASLRQPGGLVLGLVSVMFLAMYVRAFHRVRTGRIIVALTAIGVLVALAISDLDLPVETYLVFVGSTVASGEMAGMISKYLISVVSVDPLTGVLNRAGWESAVAKVVLPPEHPDTQIVVMALDVDNFKAVNDVYGHHVGDKVLVDITDVLCARLPVSAVLARLGGDEFAVCFSANSARSLEFLRADVSSWIPAVSVGISRVEPMELDVTAAHRRADLNLYEVKRARHSGEH
ncbi:GGDEF domain-containing protein [Rhodococcus sp. 27YEA15]|uniref:GGDEF domain-containing protein n=1 Tax=Rhodococcus sp. 27YEA15 TaxID=3156259 RepID=UPI003C7E5551